MQIRQEVVLLCQGYEIGLATSKHSADGVNRVGRVRHNGNITRIKCFGGDHIYADWEDDGVQGETVPPVCPECGEMLRPDVVWFGEQLPSDALEESFRLAENSDLMIVVGTSGNVQPAASLPVLARSSGAKVIEVNPELSEITRTAHFLLRGPAGEVLPRVVDGLRNSG